MSSPEEIGEAAESLVARLDYPMYILTTGTSEQPAGCLVGFATQCSIDPLRYLICLSKNNHTHRAAAHSDTMVLHFLGGNNKEMARLFGETTSDDVDKFGQCEWESGPGDAPVLKGCRGWLAGRVIERIDLGDHTGFVLDLIAANADHEERDPLEFQDVKDFDPGHQA